MRRNSLTAIFLFSVFSSQLSLANEPQISTERWILKNATQVATSFNGGPQQLIRQMRFGDDTFSIVEVATAGIMSTVLQPSLKQANRAQDAFPDFKVDLMLMAKNDTGAAPAPGWHVQKMRYAELPVDQDGRGLIVAVMDTGVDYKHPALRAKMWRNPGEIPANGIDDDGNGYVDDVYGYDFVNKDADPADDHGHGTHCAGVIAAEKQEDGEARGIAPGAQIMAVKIIEPKNRVTFLSDTAQAIQYAVDNGARILSNSWRVYSSWDYGTTEENTQLLKAAIRYAGEKGALFVAAAGNEGSDIDVKNKFDPIFPVGFSGLSNLVGIASSDSGDRPSGFTNYGVALVPIAAPGSDIMSTIPNGRWRSMSGTSMATPMAAGAFARAMSRGLSGIEAFSRMRETTERLPGWETKVGAQGIMNPMALLH